MGNSVLKEPSKKKELNDIIILRVLSCISVMLVHITSDASLGLRKGSISSMIFSFINTASTYVVPSFIFISGYILYYGYKNRDLKLSKFYYKRFKSILIPYIVWSIIYYMFFIKFFSYEVSIKFLVKNLIYGTMVYHLYFVIVIMQFYLLFPLILYLYKRFNGIFLTIIFLLISISFNKFVILKYSDRLFMNYIFFFGLGCSFAKYIDRVNNFIEKNKTYIIWLNIIMTFFYTIEIYLGRNYGININPIGFTWYIFSTTSIFFYYCISRILVNSSISVPKIVNGISVNSYTIYLTHPFILIILNYICGERLSIVFATVLKGAILLTSYALYSHLMLIKKSKISKLS